MEPGWSGYLTLELANLSRKEISIKEGSPIAQIMFQLLSEQTEQPYRGKYQGQKAGPQPAIFEEF
jgi:dCTP deaminase